MRDARVEFGCARATTPQTTQGARGGGRVAGGVGALVRTWRCRPTCCQISGGARAASGPPAASCTRARTRSLRRPRRHTPPSSQRRARSRAHHASLRMSWSRWLCQRSRHCLPVLPGKCCATSVHDRVPCACTSCRTSASSALDHCLRCVPVELGSGGSSSGEGWKPSIPTSIILPFRAGDAISAAGPRAGAALRGWCFSFREVRASSLLHLLLRLGYE